MHFSDPFKCERPSHSSVYRNAAFLSQCSERAAHDWLTNRTVEYNLLGEPETPADSHVLEYILYRRNIPLIDLALAEHGRSRSVLERVFRRGNSPTRVVACADPSLFVGEVVHESIYRNIDGSNLLWQIVRRGSLSELRAVCENPDLSSGFYGALIDCWGGHEESQFASERRVSSERFKHILFFLSKNRRTSTPREQSKDRDYFPTADYEYNKLFTRCWKLAQVAPVEPEWALVLAKLYKPLLRPYDVFDDVEKVLDRWRPADENLEASLDDDPPSPFPNMREQIAAKFLKPSIETSKSDDPAIRQAFYRTFDPERSEFRALDWTAWLERDDWCHIWLNDNENIWRSPLGRSKLRSLLTSRKNYDFTSIGLFGEREEEYRKAHPEWFDSEERMKTNTRTTSLEPDRMENLEHAVRKMAEAHAQRRSTDAIWFLLAALIGSLIGAAI